MKRPVSDLDPELKAFLTPCRIQRETPPALRARVLARARAIVAAGGPTRRFPTGDLPLPPRVRTARGGRLVRLAIAASVVLAAGAVGAVAALHGRGAPAPEEVAGPENAVPAPKGPSRNVDSPSSEPLAPDTESAAARPPRPARPGAKIDLFTAELDLLQRAHGAYTRRDFSAALTLIAEHARRFPNGHLAEQREALRVRSLLGSGRADEAHRAEAAFASQFPRSVLLPRVAGGTDSAKP